MKLKKPRWVKTTVPWETKKVIWQRWALGNTERHTVRFFELNLDKYPYAPLHVDTVRKVQEELLELPIECLDKLVEELPELESFIKEKRPDYLLERPGKFIPPSPHSIELATTALAIATDLEKYRKEKAACIGSPHCLGDAMFEQNAVTILAGLDKIDRAKATDLLFHIKDEFVELEGVNGWGKLQDDTITTSFINRLELKAHEGKFKGRCSHCPK